MSYMNRRANSSNPFQGETKKVLCVCSAGLLRSPTTAVILSQEPYNYNTRAVGLTQEYALIPIDDVLLTWADEIVCMDTEQQTDIQFKLAQLGLEKEVVNLKIPDSFEYRNPTLIKMIKENYPHGL